MLIRIVILGVILAGFLRAQAVLEPPMGMKWGDSPEHLIEWANRHQLDVRIDIPGKQPELRKIRECAASLRELREKVDAVVDAILARKAEVDQALFAVIENYVPERVDPIDRAILRLGTWEILFDPDVPAPVAINEAIELARTFGTSDSPRFVNGVLDKVAKG